jgi:hypothetical protein
MTHVGKQLRNAAFIHFKIVPGICLWMCFFFQVEGQSYLTLQGKIANAENGEPVNAAAAARPAVSSGPL